MSDLLASILVGGFTTIVGSGLTGFFAYKSSFRQRETASYKSRLIQAKEDIAALHDLESRYVDALATADPSKTKESWKRHIRDGQFHAGVRTPSKSATAKNAMREIQRLRSR